MRDLKEMMRMKDQEEKPDNSEAKLNALKDLRKMASEMMGEDLKSGMNQKVVVAAKDQEGLEKGLEKAQEIVEESPEEEMREEMDMEPEERIPESPEDIDAMIAELQAKKEKLMLKS